MKAYKIVAAEAREQGEKTNSMEEIPAHLAFRQIVIHEFSVDENAQPLRLNFHYREHSKHLGRRSA